MEASIKSQKWPFIRQMAQLNTFAGLDKVYGLM